LRWYWLYVWDWGSRYGSYYGAGKTILSALTRTADYFALNNTLPIALIFLVVITLRHGDLSSNKAVASTEQAPGAHFRESKIRFADSALLIWFAVSYAGVMVGGRFFAHYFIQILPSLCLIGARGLTEILFRLRVRTAAFRRAALAIIALGFVFTLVRFHGRGFLLACDLVRGSTSEPNADWYYNLRNREERLVSEVVRELPEEADSVDRLGLEALRADGPRARAIEGPSDYLFF